MQSSWCDKLASTPSVGFTLDPHYAGGEIMLTALTPILNSLHEGRKPTFTIERQEPFIVVFNTNEGYKYGLEPTKTNVTFNHRMRPKAVSGGPPIMEMLSKPMPFTAVLPETINRLIAATLLLPHPKDRTVTRFGVVSNTPVDASQLPPGVARLVEYIGKPWGKLENGFSIQIAAELGSGEGFQDRCVHTLLQSDDATDLMTIMFDYQRTFTTGKSLHGDTLQEVADKTSRAALRYFEDLAEGNMFDGIGLSDKIDA